VFFLFFAKNRQFWAVMQSWEGKIVGGSQEDCS
jgi:hypothetical protein